MNCVATMIDAALHMAKTLGAVPLTIMLHPDDERALGAERDRFKNYTVLRDGNLGPSRLVIRAAGGALQMIPMRRATGAPKDAP